MKEVIFGIWNHRVVKRKYDNGEIWYGIYEVFYDEKNKPNGVTKEPESITGENMEDLKEYYKMMKNAFNYPILDYDKDFKE